MSGTEGTAVTSLNPSRELEKNLKELCLAAISDVFGGFQPRGGSDGTTFIIPGSSCPHSKPFKKPLHGHRHLKTVEKRTQKHLRQGLGSLI